jgi:hydrogenase expression/formation protein HypD
VVFFAIGFETTAPANAMVVKQAKVMGLKNFSVLVSHVTVPPAIAAVMSSPKSKVDGFLAAGHVCTVMGTEEHLPLAKKFKVPIVVTGFEPVDLTLGVLKLVTQLEKGETKVENAYRRTAPSQGSESAQAVIREVFTITDRAWRGIGIIPKSGYKLRSKYKSFDALTRFPHVKKVKATESKICRSGDVLQGLIRPDQCPAFGKQCTPLTPLGATMVSSEGACAAYYKYGRLKKEK